MCAVCGCKYICEYMYVHILQEHLCTCICIYVFTHHLQIYEGSGLMSEGGPGWIEMDGNLGVSQIRGTILGGPHNKDYTLLRSILGFHPKASHEHMHKSPS